MKTYGFNAPNQYGFGSDQGLGFVGQEAVPVVPIAPNAPTNFTASDDEYEQITFAWDNSTIGTPTPTYDIMIDGGATIASGVTSPHTESIAVGTEDYKVRATNSEGFADGNIDGGTSLADTTTPIYLMTEPLVATGVLDGNGDEIYALNNSASSGELFDADLYHTGDGSKANTRAWIPNATQYPEDGTIDMSIQGDGFGSIEARTNWIAPQDEEWTMSGIYNVVMGVSYDMYSIHYKGNQTCDIYLGSNTEDLVLSESDKDYTPPTGNWIIEEEPPDIIISDPYGPELLPPLADVAWQVPAGWTVVGETFEVSQAAASYFGPEVLGICELGKTYKYEYTIINYTDGTVQVLRPFTGTSNSANGDYTQESAATETDFRMRDTAGGGTHLTISNISLKELL